MGRMVRRLLHSTARAQGASATFLAADTGCGNKIQFKALFRARDLRAALPSSLVMHRMAE
jgi:hypothetical protein